MKDNNTSDAITSFANRELGNIKVLMVEDDSFFSELVLSKLSEQGCVPYSTDNGEEALGLAKQYHPDLIILDLMLPGLQGEDILKTLKDDVELKVIPVIVFSNKSNQSDIDNVLKSGAAKFMIKSSTDLNDLTTVVKGVLHAASK